MVPRNSQRTRESYGQIWRKTRGVNRGDYDRRANRGRKIAPRRVHEKDTRSLGRSVAAAERMENSIADRTAHTKAAETIKTDGDMAAGKASE